MMVSLFSVFDPYSWGLNANWSVMALILFFMFPFYFKSDSWFNSAFGGWLKYFYESLSGVMGAFYKGAVILGVGLFMFIVMLNMLGLFPYTFSSTAHPFITMSMGILLWLSCFLMGWISFKNSAAHLTPQGCPLVLAPFLVMIESVSHLIRPFTLSIRLAANMMAGHLILGLISSVSLGFAVLGQSVLLLLEVGVCVIQGLVFSILFLLYAVEYY